MQKSEVGMQNLDLKGQNSECCHSRTAFYRLDLVVQSEVTKIATSSFASTMREAVAQLLDRALQAAR